MRALETSKVPCRVTTRSAQRGTLESGIHCGPTHGPLHELECHRWHLNLGRFAFLLEECRQEPRRPYRLSAQAHLHRSLSPQKRTTPRRMGSVRAPPLPAACECVGNALGFPIFLNSRSLLVVELFQASFAPGGFILEIRVILTQGDHHGDDQPTESPSRAPKHPLPVTDSHLDCGICLPSLSIAHHDEVEVQLCLKALMPRPREVAGLGKRSSWRRRSPDRNRRTGAVADLPV